jgi:hypothetical protein
MKIYCCMICYSDGTIDMEFLDSEPTESFRDGLDSSLFLAEGDIEYWEIREGNLNGGDSLVIYQSNG